MKTTALAHREKIRLAAGMEEWTECGDFIEADVIRFTEAVCQRKGPKGREKSYRVGDREVVAQVMDQYRDKEGVWVVFEVIESKVTDDQTGGRLVHPLVIKKEYKRALEKLVTWGKPRRLLWSDEENRAMRLAKHAGTSPRRHKKA